MGQHNEARQTVSVAVSEHELELNVLELPLQDYLMVKHKGPLRMSRCCYSFIEM